MFYVIYVPNDVPRLGIAAGSEFQLYARDKGDMPLPEFVTSELGLIEGEYEVI